MTIKSPERMLGCVFLQPNVARDCWVAKRRNPTYNYKRLHIIILLLLYITNTYAAKDTLVSEKHNMIQIIYNKFHQILTEGETELYIPAYTWHNRYMYVPHSTKRFNEIPWGGGFGKSLDNDEKGYEHDLFAFAFMDSNRHLEPIMGYGILKTVRLDPNTKIGAGMIVGITARKDMYSYKPFPGTLPWLSCKHKRTTIGMTYIPGRYNIGNVLFVVINWALP